MAFLIDAIVLSEVIHSEPSQKVLRWLNLHDASLYVSTITLAEILKGVHLLEHGRKREKVEAWFEETMSFFAGRIVPFDEDACRTWGELYAKHQRRGRLLPSLDSLIAAIAIANNLTVATRNTADFPEDVRVFNPWD